MPKVIVCHSYYGCDTGCCGHVINIDGEEEFEFTHPYGDDFRKFAEDLIKEYGCDPSDLDWESCEVTDSC